MSNIELQEFITESLEQNPFLEYAKDHATFASRANDDMSNIVCTKYLKGHISEQIDLTFTDYREKIIAYSLLDELSPSGYLTADIEEIATTLKCSTERVLGVLRILQTFEPSGIFARDVRECLLIQLKDRDILTPVMQKIVDHITLVANGNLRKLSKICQVNIDAIKLAVKRIRSLNPKPANGFFFENLKYKIPDIQLTFDADGAAHIANISSACLRVNQGLATKVKNYGKEVLDFTKRQIASANNIVKSIHQRESTIIQITEAIVESQMNFFTKGVMYFHTITLSDIAQKTGFNESTISRAISNKCISTPNGIFEFRYFFSSSVNSHYSQSVSSTKIKVLIKQIIDKEGDQMLSDDQVSQLLTKFGTAVARRTVAKYREILKIPNVSIRKRQATIGK